MTTSKSAPRTIRSKDVGFGGVKYTRQVAGDEVLCDSFAALAAAGSRASNDTIPTDTVETTIDGTTYSCGNEAHLALTGLGFGRVQRPDYPRTPQYQSLINASLFYMGLDELDLLVLGLPVSTFNREKQVLIDRVKGIHTYSRLERSDKPPRQLQCNVKNVLVLRQPMGGLYDVHTTPELFAKLSDGNTLVLDPGFFTLDWIVALDKKPIEDRCGASNNGGVSSVYKAVANKIQDETGEQVDISRVEAAYNKGGIIRVAGERITLSQYDNIVENTLNETLNEMESKIKGYSDIENIVVVGGPAELYKRILQPRVPKFEILVPHNPIYANVRGFQVAGEIWAENNL